MRELAASVMFALGMADMAWLHAELIPRWLDEAKADQAPRAASMRAAQSVPEAPPSHPPPPRQRSSASASPIQVPRSILDRSATTSAGTVPQAVDARPIAGSPRTVHFGHASARIGREGQAVLLPLIEELKRSKSVRVRLRGGADRLGLPIDNLIMARARAASVKMFLEHRGIESTRIVVDEPTSRDLTCGASTSDVGECRRVEIALEGDVQ